MQKKNRFIMVIICLIILSGCTQIENRTIETRINENRIEWKYESEDTWNYLLNLDEINLDDDKEFDYWINDVGNLEIQINQEIYEFISKDNHDFSYIKNMHIDNQQLVFEYQNGTIEKINLDFLIGDETPLITDMSMNELGELLITFKSGEIKNLGVIKGLDGKDGAQGNNGSTGQQGLPGPSGPKGDIGEQGLSTFDIYVKTHPNYTKSETEWLDDFILGKLSLSNEFDVFNLSDFDLGLSLGFHKFKLQNDLVISQNFEILNHIDLNLNQYLLEGSLTVEAEDDGIFKIHNGLIIGDIIFSQVNSFILDLSIEGNIETYQVNSKGEILKTVDGVISIYDDLNLKVENNQSLLINSFSNDFVMLDGTIDQFHVHQDQHLIMESFSLISHIEIHMNYQLEITRSQTSVIGSIHPISQTTFKNEEVSNEDPSMIAPDNYMIGLGENLDFEITLGRYNDITAILIEEQSIHENYYTFEDGILSIDGAYLDALGLEMIPIDIVLDADYVLRSNIPTYQYLNDIEFVMNDFEGFNVSLLGVVTKILNNRLIFIEDASSTIAVYGNMDGLVIGDLIQIIGLKNIYNGLHQITNASIYHLYSHNNEINDAIDYQYGMTLIPGMRVNLVDVMISDLYEDFYGNIIFNINDEVNDTQYQVMSDARLEHFEDIKERLLMMEDQFVNLQNIILSYNHNFIFYITSMDEINTFSIIFDSNDGSSVNPITQDYLSLVTEPVNPTKEGYIFSGWYEDILLTIPYSFSTMPAHNVLVYAKWDSLIPEIDYTVNGNSITINSFHGTEDSYTIPSSIAGIPVTEIGANAFSNQTTLLNLYIPQSIITIEEYAFESVNPHLVILTPHMSKPDRWDINWNSDKLTVIWNYLEPQEIQSLSTDDHGLEVVIEGIYTGHTTVSKYFIQDDTGGIYLYVPYSLRSTLSEIDSGVKVYIRGTFNNGNPSYISINSLDDFIITDQTIILPDLVDLSLETLTNEFLSTHQGKLVSLYGYTLDGYLSFTSGQPFTFTLTNDLYQIIVSVNSSITDYALLETKLNDLMSGSTIHINQGILTLNGGVYQIELLGDDIIVIRPEK